MKDQEETTSPQENIVKKPPVISVKQAVFRIAVILGIMVCALVGVFLYNAYMKQRDIRRAHRELVEKVESYAEVAYGDKVYEDRDLEGMTGDELSEIFKSDINDVYNRKVNIKINDDTYEYSMEYLLSDVYYRVTGGRIYRRGEEDELAEYIVDVDKDLSEEDQGKIIDGKKSPTPVSVELISVSNNNEIKKIISEYQSIYDIAPKNATINAKLKIKKEKEGQVLDTSTISTDLTNYLESDNTVDLTKEYKTDEVHPDVYASYLKPIKKVIGSYTTKFIPTNARGHNIKVAAKRVNGILLNPGDEISFLDILYDDSDGNKYEESGGFLGNKVVQVEGGGICQVSTTAYDAFLTAGIVPVERHPHTCPVSYAPMGLDAALAIGTKDLVVRNTYDVPILVCTKVKDVNLTVSIYSYKKAKQGYTYKPKSIKTDGELTAKSYLDIYKGGNLVDSIALSVDTYQKAGG